MTTVKAKLRDLDINEATRCLNERLSRLAWFIPPY
jgi:hypothetical protein